MKKAKKGSKIRLAYNLIQIFTLPVFLPLMASVCLCREKYRGQFLLRMGRISPLTGWQKGIGRIWIHTMSLGEFHAARPFIQGIRRAFPDMDLILSASTASGLAALRRSSIARGSRIIALPFDFLPLVRRVLRQVRPDCFLLVETDIWPNFLWELNRQKIPSVLINGSISEVSTRRLERFPALSRFLYGPFDLLAMQSGDDAARLARLGFKNQKTAVCGNLKFDHEPVRISDKERKNLYNSTGFPAEAQIIAAGSTHPGEEEIIAEAFFRLKSRVPAVRLILAPRDTRRAPDIEKIFRQKGIICMLRSGQGGVSQDRGHDVFILDSLGELERFYSLAGIAFVGGSLVPVGGHNLLEPAAFQVPVVFGPFMESFRQVADMFAEKGAGFRIRDSRELEETFTRLLTDEKERTRAGRAALSLLESNRGVVNRYLDIVSPFIERRFRHDTADT